MPRFSAHLTQLFTERPFGERFAAAARAGFVACEFRSPFEHPPARIASWSRDAALPIILFNAPAGDWEGGERGLAALPGREHDFDAAMDRALRYADTLDVPMVHVMAGKPPADADRAACRATYVSNLRAAARLFAISGRKLLIEAINQKDQPGYFLSAQAEAHAIRDEVGEPNLFVQMDLYHTAMTEGPEAIAPLLESRLSAIAHLQLAGAPGRHEPDTGSLDYAAVFSLVDRLPYDGWIGCEYQPATTTEAGLGWMKTLVEPSRQTA
jgi:2-dehydrotetronate isomerase